MDPLTPVLYVAWYVVSRLLFFVCYNAYVYLFGPMKDADEANVYKFCFYVPFMGDAIIAVVAFMIAISVAFMIVLSPAFLMNAVDKKMAEVSEKRQLRLKESDKVGLLSEVEK